MYLYLSVSFFGQVMSPHHSDQMSRKSQVSRIALWWCSLIVFVIVIVFLVRSCTLITLIKWVKGHKSLWSLFEGVLLMYLSLSLFLSLSLSLPLSFFGPVMSPHHSGQMSQRLQVSRIALWRCSLNVFVFVIVFVFAFVFVIGFFLVRSCPLITLIKCLKGQKSLGLLFDGVL